MAERRVCNKGAVQEASTLQPDKDRHWRDSDGREQSEGENKQSQAQSSPFIQVKGLIYESCEHYRLWKDLAIWKGFLLPSWLGGTFRSLE